MPSPDTYSTHVVIDQGGDNEFTFYAERVEEDWQKNLILIEIPQSTANQDQGPKATRILDLLKLNKSITFTGFISSDDLSTYRAWRDTGGTFTVSYDGLTREVNYQKTNMTKDGSPDEHRRCVIQVVEGVNQ